MQKKSFSLLLLALMLTPLWWSPTAAQEQPWTLDKAIDYALAHNPDLQETGQQVRVAEEKRREVAAGFYPQITAEGGYQYIDNVQEIEIDFVPDIPLEGIPEIHINKKIEMGQHDNYLAQFKLQQIAFASGRVFYGHRAMDGQVETSRRQVAAGQLIVARNTAEAFLGVLISQEVYQARRAAFDSANAHLEHVTHRYEAGASSRFEMLRAQVEVANLEPEVTQAANQIDLAKTAFRRVLGLNKDDPVEVSGQLETTQEAIDEDQAVSLALARRPEFAAYQAGMDALEDAAKSRRAEMLPTVVLTGSYSWQKPYFTNFDGDTNWTAGVGIQVPLFDGLRAYRGMESQRAQAETLRFSTQRLRADIDRDIRLQRLALDEAFLRIRTTKENFERAESMVAIAEDSYVAGALTSLDVIDAQLAATYARVAYLKALYDYRVAKVRLAAATGDLAAIGR